MSHAKNPGKKKHKPKLPWRERSPEVIAGIERRILNMPKMRPKVDEPAAVEPQPKPAVHIAEPLPDPPKKEKPRRAGPFSFHEVMTQPELTTRPENAPHPPGDKQEDPPWQPESLRPADDDSWMLDVYHGGRRPKAR